MSWSYCGGVRSPRPSASAVLARRVSVTAWYTVGSVLLFLLGTLLVWALPLVAFPPGDPLRIAGFAAGSALVLVGAAALLVRYRRLAEEHDDPEAERIELTWAAAWPLATGIAGSLLAGLASQSLVLAAALLAMLLFLLRWGRGIRWRAVLVSTAALAGLWVIEGAALTIPPATGVPLPHPMFAFLLPFVTAISMWSWDIVLELDRARGTEARLAAAQERLRLAHDLHDLQGHHLQVIALQLELAERMLPRDPAAAAEQIVLARGSVDEARRGTRELAGRFRGVPLPDELANAGDLLRAAGLRVEVEVDPRAAEAPADVLGPVIRESTTNVLKHGAGGWARLSLHRRGAEWELRVDNDVRSAAAGAAEEPDAGPVAGGAGLAGIAARVAAVGGTHAGERDGDRFAVVVRVPVDVRAHRGGVR